MSMLTLPFGAASIHLYEDRLPGSVHRDGHVEAIGWMASLVIQNEYMVEPLYIASRWAPKQIHALADLENELLSMMDQAWVEAKRWGMSRPPGSEADA